MKKLIISILPIFMSLCVNAQIKLKGVRLYSNTYYYELKDVFVDTKGEQFTLESMRIMFYSPNGSDITVAIQIPGEAPIFMKVDDTKEEPLYDGYNKVGKLLKNSVFWSKMRLEYRFWIHSKHYLSSRSYCN